MLPFLELPRAGRFIETERRLEFIWDCGERNRELQLYGETFYLGRQTVVILHNIVR